jgi:excisionase family DNA binding protein
MSHRLLSVRQAAERLGLRESTVRRMVLERRIDTVRPCKRAVRIPLDAIMRLLEHNYRPAVSQGMSGDRASNQLGAGKATAI